MSTEKEVDTPRIAIQPTLSIINDSGSIPEFIHIPPTPIDPPAQQEATDSKPSVSFEVPLKSNSLTSPHPSPLRANSLASSPNHRRNSSSDRIKESLNAYSRNLPESSDGIARRTINSYELSTPLGQGSYAMVYLATDRENGVQYAAKEFSKTKLRKLAANEAKRAGGRGRLGPRKLAGTESGSATSESETEDEGVENLNLIKKEVAIMKKVHHRNLARIHEIIDVIGEVGNDSLLIVMELCSGGPIVKINVDSPDTTQAMSEEAAKSIFAQIVEGIAYLHHNWIVHRDIKPENILLLADKKTVKIVDFGVSMVFETDDDSLGAGSYGTPAFMAPELYTKGNCSPHGFECDIYSLGVTLYSMVVGKLPFWDSSITELARSILEDEPIIPSQLSLELQNFLRSLLEKNPATRITIPEIWENPWISGSLNDYESTIEELENPSEYEIGNAFNAMKTWRSSANVLRAIGKFRKSRKSTSGSTETNEGVERAPLPMLLTTEPLPMDTNSPIFSESP